MLECLDVSSEMGRFASNYVSVWSGLFKVGVVGDSLLDVGSQGIACRDYGCSEQ